MTTLMEQWIKIGTDLGYKGTELQAFVKEQQAIARDERDKERTREKERAEEEMRRTEEETRRAAEETKRAEEETKRVEINARVETDKARLANEKELAIIEKQKLEIQEKAKRDALELEVKRMMAGAEIHGNTDDTGSEAGAEEGSEAGLSTTGLRRRGGNGKPRGPKLTPFDEKDDMDSYIHRFEQIAKLEQWPETSWSIYLASLLRGKALDVYTRLPIADAEDYEVLKEALLRRYEKTEEGYRKLFYSARADVGEGQLQFMVRLENYLMKYVELSGIKKDFNELIELFVREQYLATCSKELEIFLRERSCRKLDDIAKCAEQFLSAHKAKSIFQNRGVRDEKRDERQYDKRSNNKDQRGPRGPVISSDGKRRCWICNSTKHVSRECDERNDSKPATKRTMAMQTERDDNDEYSDNGQDEDECYLEETAAMDMRDMRPARSNFTRESTYPNRSQQRFKQWKRSVPNDPDKDKTWKCKTHGRELCSECLSSITADKDHECNALIADVFELKCGCKIPVVADACRVAMRDNMPVSEGFINGQAVKVLRDSGCSTVVVKRDLVSEDQLTGAELRCVMIDGTVRRTPVAKVHIDTQYFTGEVEAVCMRNPLYEVILGNIPGIDDKGNAWQPRDLMSNKQISQNSDTDNDDCANESTAEQLQAVVTRRMARDENKTRKPLNVIEGIDSEVTRERFVQLQKDDETLRSCWDKSKTQEAYKELEVKEAKYIMKSDILYRQCKTNDGRIITQLILPSSLRNRVIKLAHESIMSGHQGITKTKDRVLAQFWYPGITADIERFCKSCDICQRTVAKGRITRAPLGSMPIIETPFERVAVDLIGEIRPKTDRGHRWILTVVDYATRYPEATALKDISTETVAEALVEIYSRVGIPKEVLSDQGSQFVGDVMKEVSRLLSVRQLVTSPYHPICNGLVEKFNGTLKSMLKKVSAEKPQDWDRYIAPLLFAYRGVKQESLGFSPFELLYGRTVRGPMEILRELWTKENMGGEVKSTYEYVVDLRNRISETCELARTELQKAQEKQRNYYNRKAVKRNIRVGRRVLVLRPTSNNKLLMQWQGPFDVTAKENENDYRIDMNGKSRLYHINMLKEYVERENQDEEHEDDAIETKGILYEYANAAVIEPDEPDESELLLLESGQKETWRDVDINPGLETNQIAQVRSLVEEFKDIFTDLPRITNLGVHEIHLTTNEPVRSKPYPLPHAMRVQLSKEIDTMLSMDIIETSTAAYASPIVMVRKSDNSVRVCCDFRKLNKLTVFDPEPMTTADDIFVKLKGCQYFSKFDLSKGYWQVRMKESDKCYTSFITHEGLYQFKVMPFGLVNAPATFSRIMRLLLDKSQNLYNYLDDVLAPTFDWQQQLTVLRDLFVRVRKANLSIRPTKCSIGYFNITFLGFDVSAEGLKPASSLVDKMLRAPRPVSKKQLRSFLGLVGFYRRFVPHFASVAAPLTDLTKKGSPNTLEWGPAQQNAFVSLRKVIASEPVLCLPDYSKGFLLQTDACNEGIGALLLQEIDGLRHPIGFASRKLLPREQNYATIERECLAIVWGISKFDNFLYGQHFILEVDHEPLRYLSQCNFKNSRLTRWALSIQPYRFTVRHIKGVDNVGADFLSRHSFD